MVRRSLVTSSAQAGRDWPPSVSSRMVKVPAMIWSFPPTGLFLECGSALLCRFCFFVSLVFSLECGSALLCRFCFFVSLVFSAVRKTEEKQEKQKRQSKALPHSREKTAETKA